MGWCSGTYVFDALVSFILPMDEIEMSKRTKIDLIKTIIETLWDEDWDCETDSDYFSHPTVKQAFTELDPDMYGGV